METLQVPWSFLKWKTWDMVFRHSIHESPRRGMDSDRQKIANKKSRCSLPFFGGRGSGKQRNIVLGWAEMTSQGVCRMSVSTGLSCPYVLTYIYILYCVYPLVMLGRIVIWCNFLHVLTFFDLSKLQCLEPWGSWPPSSDPHGKSQVTWHVSPGDLNEAQKTKIKDRVFVVFVYLYPLVN